jgi:hypothetical protein
MIQKSPQKIQKSPKIKIFTPKLKHPKNQKIPKKSKNTQTIQKTQKFLNFSKLFF